MAQIKNLLEKAKLAKELFVVKLVALKTNGMDTSNIYICNLFRESGKEYDDWRETVGKFMSTQLTTGWNNIASHVSDTVFYDDNIKDSLQTSTKRITVETVRLQWLKDLIVAAEQYGDKATLPNIMSQGEIKSLYNDLYKGK